MRMLVALCVLLFGCAYETNNYYATGDGGVIAADATHADDGDDMPSIFKRDSKLSGSGTLQLTPAPPAPAAGQPWPDIMNVAAERAGAQTFVDLETADGFPHVVTVSMGFVGPLPTFVFDATGTSPELVAILDIGIGGLSVTAEVDFVDGVQFSLACNRLQIHVAYRLLPGGPLVITPAIAATIQAGISVASGTVAHGRQPQRTLGSIASLNANAFEVFRVPAFAKSLLVAGNPVNGTPTIQFWNVNGLLTDIFAVAGYPSNTLPVANDARAVVYWNTNLNQDVSRRLIFDLSL